MYKKRHTRISLVGDFDFGEKLNPITIDLIDLAREDSSTDFAVLIGDIGIRQKIEVYLKFGIEGIQQLYLHRLKCVKSYCAFSQLPRNMNEIKALIDPSHYELARNLIAKYEDADIVEVIDKKILPSIIAKRLESYNLPDNSLILSERNIRNIASARMKRSQGKSWRHIKDFRLTKEGVFIGGRRFTNEKRMPICSAIIFSLNEYIAQLGYQQVNYYIMLKQFSAVSKGWLVFERYQKQLPYLINTIESAKIISNENS